MAEIINISKDTGKIIWHSNLLYERSAEKIDFYEFTDTLVYSRIIKSNISKTITFLFKSKSDPEKEYYVLPSEIDKFIKNMNSGEITGVFTFCYKGTKLSLKYLE